MRKLNSRCLGLLEWHGDENPFSPLSNSQEENDDDSSTKTDFGCVESIGVNVPLDAAELLDRSEVFFTAHLTVDFLHRSLRDFLLTPEVQTLLHHYTNGAYDARMFFRNARLAQLLALNQNEAFLDDSIGLASYILSTLTVPEYRETSSAADVATIMQPVVENLVCYKHTESISGWYICCVLQSWHKEESTFLTLAIDFGLNSYIRANLTPQSVQSKKGRPILDYILRPRFRKMRPTMCVGNQLPDLALLNVVLAFDMDPNQRYHGVSIWALFLCFIADRFGGETPDTTPLEKSAYFEALKIMIQNGADVLLPRAWLSSIAYYQAYGWDSWFDNGSEERFLRRFSNITPKIQGSAGDDIIYAVSDLLEHFKDRFGFRWGTLKTVVLQREAQVLASVPSSELTSSIWME
ncbi:hypothetical protein GJ744_001589 [Endocarpon pusillum]|uniref:DUF7791 domain-containing protein n=1 Tax=Endocarpon pusillum TaxID=364733 RepID=A0A8H7E0J6_9EURO|nr:hypothetical protein GJ744_001589 [Endocarpon pusillum]